MPRKRARRPRRTRCSAIADAKSGYVMQLEPRKHKLVMDLATLIGAHYRAPLVLPTPLRAVFVVAGYMAFLRAALHELAQPRLTVPVARRFGHRHFVRQA